MIVRKIIKIVATRCQILKAKMHQIRFRLRLRPRPRWGSLQRSPLQTVAGFKGPTSKGREGRGREGDRDGKEGVRKKERGGRGKGKGGESVPLALILQFDHCLIDKS